MIQFYKKIIDLGVVKVSDEAEIFRLRMLNKFILIIVPTLIGFGIAGLFINMNLYLKSVTFAVALLFVILSVLNRAGLFTFSRIVLFAGMSILITGLIILFGLEMNFQYYFVLLVGIPFLLFDLKYFRYQVGFTFFILLTGIFLNFYFLKYNHLIEVSKTEIVWLQILNTLLSLVTMFVLAYEFARGNNTYIQLLNQKQEYDAILAGVSQAFLSHDDFDKTMNEVLATLGNKLGASRVRIHDHNYEKNSTSIHYEWCAEGTEAKIKQLQNVPYSTDNKLLDILIQRGKIEVRDVQKSVSSNAISVFRLEDAKSLLGFPVYLYNEYSGIILFEDNVTNREWNTEVQEFLQAASGIIANGLAASVYFEDLKASNRRLEMALSNGQAASWQSNLITGETHFSDSFYQMSGYSKSEFENTTNSWQEIIHPEDRSQVFKAMEEHNTGLKPSFKVEYRIRKRTGEYCWVRDEGKVVEFDSENKPVLAIGAFINITREKEDFQNLKKAKEVAEQNQLKFTTLFNEALDSNFIIDPETGLIIEANDTSCRKYGYTKEELEQMPLQNIVYEENRKGILSHVEEVLKQGSERFTDKHVTRDGQIIDVYVSAKTVNFDGRQVILTTFHDISEELDMKNRLTENELRWKYVLEENSDGIWDWNIKTNEAFFSKQWKKLLGFEEDEIKSTLEEWEKRVHPDDLKRVNKDKQDYLEGRTTSYVNEQRLQKKDGTYVWILDRGMAVEWDENGRPTRMIGSHSDITSQRLLQNERESLLSLFNIGTSVLFTWKNIDGFEIDYVSENVSQLLGYVATDFTDKSVSYMDCIAPDAFETTRAQLDDALASSANFVKFGAYSVIAKDGTAKWVRDLTVIQRDENHEVTALIKYLSDITEEICSREMAEKSGLELEAANRELNLITQSSPDAILMLNAKGELTFWNPAATEIFGYSEEEIMGKNLHLILAPKQYHEQHSKGFSQFIKTGEGTVLNKVVELTALHKKGHEFNIGLKISPIFKDNEWHALGIVRDITESKNAEIKVIEAKERAELNEIKLKEAQSLARVGNWEFELNENKLFWSDELYRILGLQPKEIDPSYEMYSDFIHPDDREMSKKAYSDHLITAETYDIVYRFILKDGSVIYVNERCQTEFDKAGKAVRSVGTVADITERILAEKELKIAKETAEYNASRLKEVNHELSTITDTSPDAIIRIDNDGKITFWNPAAEKIFGYSADEVFGKSAHEVLAPAQYKDRYSKGFSNFAKTGSIYKVGEFEAIHKDGHKFYVQIKLSPIFENNKWSAIGIVRDVTDNVLAEIELKAATKKAQQANKAKSEFLANMSHEIRTPLNGIIGLTDILLDTKVDAVQEEYLHKLENSSRSLLHIINDILDYSKIEAGKLEIVAKEFEFDDLLKNVSNLFGFSIEKKSLMFHFGIDPEIPGHLTGDALRLTQVLNNLIGNAVKFTNEGHIALKCRVLKKEKKQLNLEFCIEDTGIGISEKNQGKLFESFNQADNSITRKYGGTGLGLTISKQLIELMGGKIWMESKEGEGSKFFFTLPFEYEEEKTMSNEFEGQKYLIVEDSDIDRQYLSKTLSKWGIKAKEAVNGEEALKMIKSEAFDNILLDWAMPKMDGLTLLEALQQQNIQIPHIVMITAYAKNDMMSKAQEKHIFVEKIIEKPYTPTQLYNAIFNERQKNKNQESSKIPEMKITTKNQALLVEDNITNQLVQRILLERYGLVISIAKDGQEAIDILKERNFDIVFMDVQMPGIDGYEATRQIRKFNTEVPIVALSAAALQKDKEMAQESGMNDHIAKPIIKSELEAILDQYLLQHSEKDADPKESNLKSIKGFDYHLLYELVQDEEVVIQILKSFIDSYTDPETVLNSDLPSATLRQHIHSLKGAAGSTHMSGIYALTKKMDENSDDHFLKEHLDELKSMVKEMVSSLNQSIK